MPRNCKPPLCQRREQEERRQREEARKSQKNGPLRATRQRSIPSTGPALGEEPATAKDLGSGGSRDSKAGPEDDIQDSLMRLTITDTQSERAQPLNTPPTPNKPPEGSTASDLSLTTAAAGVSGSQKLPKAVDRRRRRKTNNQGGHRIGNGSGPSGDRRRPTTKRNKNAKRRLGAGSHSGRQKGGRDSTRPTMSLQPLSPKAL
ncbi:hypothetical protein MYCTH_2124537 [Thermothelomyces thermophilus ATCC 42464]|uniref:Uncharacterized protein n=1 Tax=Thermothelomyces thermophilus (strain ATCC 42464 / BCRC 31852 / DSM 1799) TaxID=573729 RepID=G2Q6L8_THET4|nr:uncharacterized protein MYCTH_2124537 [Thermothelomyces thermophilus ATCC 42464]AEO55591.1 hypothetical protein MYCTH_2124537 [Thermothelomyces thermophilus ATCC 42464]